MIYKKMRAVALVLFGWTMIGAKDCGLWTSTSPTGPGGAPPPPPPQFCLTDPPLDCYAVCFAGPVADMMPPDMPPTPTGCGGGGDLAKMFVNDVQTILVCDTSQAEPYAVFPPKLQITPVLIETGGGCVRPPALPDEMPMSVLMNLLMEGMAP